MDIKLVLAVSVVIIFVISFALFMWFKKKNKTVAEELRLFKKEKEYFSESMIVFSENYDVVFANQAAKALFSLDDMYQKILNATPVELKIDTQDSADFFKVLEKESKKREDSFHLKNILLVTMGKAKKVNIYVDKSGWNLNKTITCVIDMDVILPAEVNSAQNDGSVDFFTGLPSQFAALSQINTLVMKSQKSLKSFTLFLFGIDHFSEIQATLGLAFSNKIIKDISEYLANHDKNMHVYRMDCDKFLLVLEQTQSHEEAHAAAKKMIVDMKRDEKDVRLTASIGIAMYPKHGENAPKLIHQLYMALDQAQKESDSNIVFYKDEFQTLQKHELNMNEEIQKGLKNHEFFLYYQPIFNLKTEEMMGVEALVRWNHPELGLVTADKFLEVAKKTGLIIDIGEYVFREAIKQRKVWNDEGLKDFKITLNLSLREMQVDKLIQKLEILFEDHSVNPRGFNLDITEKSAMINVEKSAVDFKHFRDLGLSISIDNFGAGTSSLKHLQMLPLSMIKIDRSLIFDLYTNLDHQITVKSMITLIHNLGFEVVAEGVETSRESSLLYDFGCDHAQGYLFSQPLPAQELAELLT